MSTTPNSFDDELDELLRGIINSHQYIDGDTRYMTVQEFSKPKHALKQLYLTHRNAEYKKLLEQKVSAVHKGIRFDAVHALLIENLMKEK